MNVTSFTMDGPTMQARVPLPQPSDTPIRPYPWDEFLNDMQAQLNEYASHGVLDVRSGDMMRHVADDGTCYWIRADRDDGTRFLRVFVRSYDVETGKVIIDLEPCSQAEVPGRLRLN